MVEKIKQQAQEGMEGCVTSFKQTIAKIRVGRAHPSLLEGIRVDYYGTSTPISQLASVVAEDSRMLALTVYDRSAIHAVEKAILTSNLGLNPQSAGSVLRIPLPPLTEERRNELVKQVRAEAEQSRVGLRALRREANEVVKKQSKDKVISSDQEHQLQEEIQKLTDLMVKKIDTLLQQKERDLMEF